MLDSANVSPSIRGMYLGGSWVPAARTFDDLTPSDNTLYARVPDDQRRLVNRYHRGSLSDPSRRPTNWNRSFVLPAEAPDAGVLLLHGMSDSPYSLRALGQRLNRSGALVVGLRIPGHGTAPSGLVEATWQDMAAAVRFAMDHLAAQAPGRPLYIVGYSNGAALAVEYALAALEDERLPRAQRLVLLSPAIGVSPVAALAVWQALLGHLLGMEKLAWNAILPEYDPYKYGSFAVNAGDQVHRITGEIQSRLDRLSAGGGLDDFPPVLAFASVVDATVSTPALVDGLFARLPAGERELVLFDIDRTAEIEPLLTNDPGAGVRAIAETDARRFALSLVTNAAPDSRELAVQTWAAGAPGMQTSSLGLAWPRGVYSLSHVALPFPEDDPLYGVGSKGDDGGIQIGRLALRGERGVLQISAAEMLRLRWNPFYPYLEGRVLDFVGLAP